MKYITYSESDKIKNDDKIVVLPIRSGLVCCCADGSTGTGEGDMASAFLIESFMEKFSQEMNIHTFREIILNAENKIQEKTNHAETTGILCFLKNDGQFYGVSVGDSLVYNINNNKTVRININTKPRIGNGARIQEFYGKLTHESYLMIATDGISHQCPNIETIKTLRPKDIITFLRGQENLYDDFSLALLSL